MKKSLLLLALLCGLLATTCQAEEAIPARYAPILEDWNATTALELHLNILEYWKETDSPNASHYSPRYMPLSIRFGGTTRELIADQKNWDLAIVSLKDVDLQALVAEGLIMKKAHYPCGQLELYQWLLPDNLQAKLPQDPLMVYYVYFYDYDVEADDATLLICQDNIGRKKNRPHEPNKFAEAMMWKRSAAIARTVEGFRLLPDLEELTKWTEDDLLAHVEEWDVAVVTVDQGNKLESLDQAGLLFDFSLDDYFPSRTAMRPYERDAGDSYDELPNGVFSAGGRMIGIPCVETMVKDDGEMVGMLILNAQSPYLERAQTYAVHFMKSKDWSWTAENKMWPHGCDTCLYKDEMDW